MKPSIWLHRLARPLLAIGLLSLLAKGLQALAGILLAYRLGADHATDAYTVAKSLPVGAYLIADSLIYHGLVPLWSHKTPTSESGRRFLGAVLLGTLAVTALLTLVVEASAFPLLRWLLPGAAPDTILQAAGLCRLMTLALPAALPASLLKAWNASRGRYGYAALDAFLMHVTMIAALLAAPAPWGVWPVAIALPCAFLLLVAIQILGARTDFRPAAPRNITPHLREFGTLLAPLLGINAILQANTLFMNAAASYTGEGSVSCMLYSYTMAQAPVSLLETLLLSTLFPYASMLSSERRYADFRTAFHAVARTLLFALVPLGVWMAAAREDLVALLLNHGHFDADDTKVTALCFLGHSLAIAFWALEAFAYRCLFALKRHACYLRIAAARVLANMLACAILVPWLGLVGVVLAFAATYVLGSVWACLSVSRLLDAAGSAHVHILSTRHTIRLALYAGLAYAIGLATKTGLAPHPAAGHLIVGALACGILIMYACRSALTPGAAPSIPQRRIE